MTAFALRTIDVAHRQAVLDAQTCISPRVLGEALRRTVRLGRATIYRETEERARWRKVFEVAQELPDTVLVVTALKTDGSTRTFNCRAVPGGDYTRRYALVIDLEKGDYRRINLDGIVKVTMETHAEGLSSPGLGE